MGSEMCIRDRSMHPPEVPPTPSAPKRTRAAAQLDAADNNTGNESISSTTPSSSPKKLKLNVGPRPSSPAARPRITLKLERNINKPVSEAQQTVTPQPSSSETAITSDNTPVKPEPEQTVSRNRFEMIPENPDDAETKHVVTPLSLIHI